MKAVILAGGFGSRMGDMCKEMPKPMLEICGKPILLHQVEFFLREGITEFIFVTGYLSEKIEDFFGDGSHLGASIEYFRETEPLGTGGALFRLGLEEDFILCNGDLVFDFDLTSMIAFHKKKKALATLFVHPNSHPYDSLTIKCDTENRVTGMYGKNSKPEFYPNICNAGVQIISPLLLEVVSFSGNMNLDRDILAKAVTTGGIYAYRSAEYIHDTGTPERMEQTGKDIVQGIVAEKNIRLPQKAVFIDRDGTLNKHKGYISDPADIELTEGTARAVKCFNALGYLTVVVTNQPVIARGECDFGDMENIHNRLEMLLAEDGAYVDGIYFCPHHPDKGFEGEREELKIRCNCRKPSPGMLIKAQQDFNIDFSRSFMVGDSEADAQAGKAVGCTCVSIGKTNAFTELNFPSVEAFSQYLMTLQ